jgi:Lon protease-like protein
MAMLPMFPLGSVLLPGSLLPLHVFEPRYRQLVRDCLDGEPEFGVTLIERGWEVGGGDVRTSIGTVARILEVLQLPDGRYGLTTVGTRRVRVRAWLADDPYPRADVEDWPDEADSRPTTAEIEAVAARVRRVLALAAELGDTAPPVTTEISDDPVLASYHLCALSPLGPADRQDLLAAPGPAERVDLLDQLLDGIDDVLRFRLTGGADGQDAG